ncbi:MAG: hypothetical protein IPG89_09060 [Bacteroidetes bacterium]|nr:hypothetical protein [Bacteroidota bacterium]
MNVLCFSNHSYRYYPMNAFTFVTVTLKVCVPKAAVCVGIVIVSLCPVVKEPVQLIVEIVPLSIL